MKLQPHRCENLGTRIYHFFHPFPDVACSLLVLYTEMPLVSCYALSCSASKDPASITVHRIRFQSEKTLGRKLILLIRANISDSKYMHFTSHVTVTLCEYIACIHVFTKIIYLIMFFSVGPVIYHLMLASYKMKNWRGYRIKLKADFFGL